MNFLSFAIEQHTMSQSIFGKKTTVNHTYNIILLLFFPYNGIKTKFNAFMLVNRFSKG
jgi:hypothetical protein